SWGFPPVRVGRRQAFQRISSNRNWSFLCFKKGTNTRSGMDTYTKLSSKTFLILYTIESARAY
ncbi:hypothetical protein, partial [Bacillus altitudinis]|uniref:hypothetical protein n=1 Tax=Bacillus altitudinis TaxID=293387 RepID=UPI001C930786